MRTSSTVALLCTLAAAPLAAQRPLTLAIAGGLSAPSGSLDATAEPGWHGMASLMLGAPIHPWGLRLDAAHHRFGAPDAGTAAAEVRQRVTLLTLNATYRLPRTNSPISPFIVAGGGGYRLDCSGSSACSATTKPGWNAGLGVRFVTLGLHGFVEGRYHRVHVSGRDARFVPVSLGLTL